MNLMKQKSYRLIQVTSKSFKKTNSTNNQRIRTMKSSSCSSDKIEARPSFFFTLELWSLYCCSIDWGISNCLLSLFMDNFYLISIELHDANYYDPIAIVVLVFELASKLMYPNQSPKIPWCITSVVEHIRVLIRTMNYIFPYF